MMHWGLVAVSIAKTSVLYVVSKMFLLIVPFSNDYSSGYLSLSLLFDK